MNDDTEKRREDMSLIGVELGERAARRCMESELPSAVASLDGLVQQPPLSGIGRTVDDAIVSPVGWSCRDVLALPAVIDVVTAGRVLGMGRTKSYALARAGAFPCRVIRAGRTYLVPTPELWRLLGLTPDSSGDAGPEQLDR